MVNIENLEFGYKPRQTLFRGLNLNLVPGNIYGLLGKNGAGKTSLLRLMAGMLFPVKGSCTIDGVASAERRPSVLQQIFFLPEEYQLPGISMDLYTSLNSPFYPRFDREKLKWLLNEFQLKSSQKLNQLSYGQKKKFLLAFGLATNARFMLMDEPTNGLDIPSKSQFRRVIAASVSDEQLLLISTHQVRDLDSLIDPVIVIDEGKIIFQQAIDVISQRLMFEAVPEGSRALYSEEGLTGFSGILPNTRGSDSRVDLELLFNGVVNNPREINQIFEEN